MLLMQRTGEKKHWREFHSLFYLLPKAQFSSSPVARSN